MSSRVLAALTASSLLLGAAAPALALDFGSSSTTNKGVTTVPLHFNTPMDPPVGLDLGLAWTQNLSDALGPANINPQWGEVSSMLFDANANLRLNFKLLDYNLGLLGRVKPVIMPYVGYRYLGIPTAELTDPAKTVAANGIGGLANAGGALSYSQFGGLNYGVKGALILPLGFQFNGGLGATTLLSGGWDTRSKNLTNLNPAALATLPVTGAGKIDVGGTTLPGFSLGATWAPLPVFSLSLGYELLVLPTLLRAQTGKLDAAKTTINNLSIGVQFLSFAI